jgi:hypothetical protein
MSLLRLLLLSKTEVGYDLCVLLFCLHDFLAQIKLMDVVLCQWYFTLFLLSELKKAYLE